MDVPNFDESDLSEIEVERLARNKYMDARHNMDINKRKSVG